MSGLGNILEPSPSGPRGPDLEFVARVPRKALGRPEGYLVDAPSELPLGDELVARARSPHDPDRGAIRLHLPEQLPQGATLRLRGQGGVRPGGSPGDLLIRVEVVPNRFPIGTAAIWLAALMAGAAAAAALIHV